MKDWRKDFSAQAELKDDRYTVQQIGLTSCANDKEVAGFSYGKIRISLHINIESEIIIKVNIVKLNAALRTSVV